MLRLISGNFFGDEIDLPSLTYQDIPTDDMWKIRMAKEIIDLKSGDIEIENFNLKDLDGILQYVCCS